MSLYQIQAIFKKPKKVVLYEDERGRQWAGDSCAAYRLYDLPFAVDHNNILDMLGVPDATRKKYEFFERVLPPVYLGDYGEQVEWQLPFMYGGELHHVIRSGDEVICVLDHYLKPLKKIQSKTYRIERFNGLKYLVVNVGAMALAVIAGEPVGEELVMRLRWTVDCLTKIAVPGQRDLFDRETGEVLCDEE